MQFRQQVRQRSWQAQFLSQAVSTRIAQAQAIRQQSEAHKRTQTVYADADTELAQTWLRSAQAHTLIHGHTHQPQDHVLPEGQLRVVLSDWDGHARPPRAQVLRLHRPVGTQAARLERLTLAQSLSDKASPPPA
jgi:UDP-2,3-diacylglucosamine hydrolase